MIIIPPKAIRRVHANVVFESVSWGIIENRVEEYMGIVDEHLALKYRQYYFLFR